MIHNCPSTGRTQGWQELKPAESPRNSPVPAGTAGLNSHTHAYTRAPTGLQRRQNSQTPALQQAAQPGGQEGRGGWRWRPPTLGPASCAWVHVGRAHRVVGMGALGHRLQPQPQAPWSSVPLPSAWPAPPRQTKEHVRGSEGTQCRDDGAPRSVGAAAGGWRTTRGHEGPWAHSSTGRESHGRAWHRKPPRDGKIMPAATQRRPETPGQAAVAVLVRGRRGRPDLQH